MLAWHPDAWKNGKKVRCNWKTEKTELGSLIDLSLALAKETQKDAKETQKDTKENQTDAAAIKKLGNGWVAEEALAIAIYSCVKYQDSFQDAIICAVNHDGDSDSTGAITGNIIGGKLGYSKIPSYYKDNIELKDVILELADDLYHGVPTDKNGDITDKTWLEKYVIINK